MVTSKAFAPRATSSMPVYCFKHALRTKVQETAFLFLYWGCGASCWSQQQLALSETKEEERENSNQKPQKKKKGRRKE